jgi:hypothetical protein
MLIAAAILLAGCVSAPSRFYTLNAAATSDGSPVLPCTVTIEPVSVPAMVDHPPITVQLDANRVELDEFNRWAEPLGDNLARVVAENLAVLLGTPKVAAGPVANFKPDYQVPLHVQRFESVPGKSVLVEALWVVQKTGGAAQSGHTIASQPVSGPGYEALVAAHSRALATVSRDLAAAIRAEAGTK